MVWPAEVRFWPHPDKLGRLGLHDSSCPSFHRPGGNFFLTIPALVSKKRRSSLESVEGEDTEGREHFGMEIELIMDILGIDSSDGPEAWAKEQGKQACASLIARYSEQYG